MAETGRVTGVGARLKRAREARGITLRELADRTKISTRCFEAIERDDPKRLPAGIFGRAFVRTYAVEVGLDADETVNDFFAQFAPPEPPPEASAPPPRRAWQDIDFAGLARDFGGLARAGTFALPVVLLAVWGWWGWTRDSDPAPIAATPIPAVSYDVPAPGPIRFARDVATRDEVVRAGGQVEGSLSLRIEANDICWVSVTADGRLVYRQLMTPGEDATIEAARELQVRVGDAGAVTLFLNGERVRSLGEPGTVVAVHIDQQNAHEFAGSRPLMQ
ncbi:MAG TPA: helix-turn-helix domain-containing protein [Vicinamibacterales bacterium]